jgi:hypothetical protein
MSPGLPAVDDFDDTTSRMVTVDEIQEYKTQQLYVLDGFGRGVPRTAATSLHC